MEIKFGISGGLIQEKPIRRKKTKLSAFVGSQR